MKRTLVLHDGEHGDASSDQTEVLRLWDAYPESYATTIWHEVRVLVADVTSLQGVVAFARELGRTARLSIKVSESVGITLLHGPLAPVDGRQVSHMSLAQSDSLTSLQIRLSYHASIWAFLSSTVSAPLSWPAGLGAETRVGIGQGVNPNWLGLAANARYLPRSGGGPTDVENPGPLPRMDVALLNVEDADGVEGSPERRSIIAHEIAAVSESRPVWQASTQTTPAPLAPVEHRIFNPIGVFRAPRGGWLYLRPGLANSVLGCDADGAVVADFDSVTPGTIAAMREYTGIVDSGAAFTGPASRAEALARFAAAGVPVVSPDASATLRGWLPHELIGALAQSTDVLTDAESREGLIINQVRTAHRFASWRSSKLAESQAVSYADPSVSVGIATMRPEYLEHVLNTFESQTWSRKQLLLGLHGFTLAEVAPELRERVSRAAIVVEWPIDGLFGDLLRNLTLRADGDLFAKMDDDDWYAPHHLEDLVYALQYSGAALVGSGVQFVYMHSADVTIRRSIDQSYRYGGHPGGPTFLAARDIVLRAGNWPRVRRAVDTGLNEAIIALGGSVYQSHAHNFLFNRRSSGHTWKATNSYFIDKAKFSWNGLRPPQGFKGFRLANEDWRSDASTIAPLTPQPSLRRVSMRPKVSSGPTYVRPPSHMTQ